jgi:hypothetical protein
VAGAREPEKCELVGYRKRDSETFAPIMELGTLSPTTTKPNRTSSALVSSKLAAADSISLTSLHAAASLPTLVGEGGLSLASSGSMPELNRANSFRKSDKRRTSSRLEQQLVQLRAESMERKLQAEAEPESSSSTVKVEDVVIQDVDAQSAAQDEGITTAGDTQSTQSLHSQSLQSEAGGEGEGANSGTESTASPDGGEDIAINGIELHPELSNEEIVEKFNAKDGAREEDIAGFRELSVDNLAGEGAHCTILEMLKDDFEEEQKAEEEKAIARLEPVSQAPKSEFSLTPQSGSPDKSHLLVPPVTYETVNYVRLKENLRETLKYAGHIYSDYPTQSSTIPYFWPPDPPEEDNGIHLVVCVHGLDGECKQPVPWLALNILTP